ncbi:hypothetical protein Acor_28060 [Acrocarpospora corrugata]|uniref:Uncharacterized protein n=1 Tax=Acrocarpospora corrugata TaxID=35763 RepID=A0A5M3VYF2_9ACTN|nr:hypothetical protein [Acrocarpospora corrugata]GES00742.1 hypothetical protein Acor_28060 [Acrocarpospora corrugata]
MKVSSPVGTFPYKVDRIEVRRSRVTIHGHMGAWPSEIEVGAEDVPRSAWLAVGAATLIAVLVVWRFRGSA